jgi:Thi4 family
MQKKEDGAGFDFISFGPICFIFHANTRCWGPEIMWLLCWFQRAIMWCLSVQMCMDPNVLESKVMVSSTGHDGPMGASGGFFWALFCLSRDSVDLTMSETDRMHLVLCGVQNRTIGSYLAAINGDPHFTCHAEYLGELRVFLVVWAFLRVLASFL